MARIFKLKGFKPEKRVLKKAGRRTERMEAAGQLNLFEQGKSTGKVIPTYGDAFLRALYLDEQDSPDALKAYEQAIKEDVRPADALCNIATIMAREGNISGAIGALSQALVNDPGHALSHYNLGNVYLEAGNLQLAELHYEQAIRVDPAMTDVYYNLALVLLVNGHRERAIKLLEEYRMMSSEEIDISELIHKLLG